MPSIFLIPVIFAKVMFAPTHILRRIAVSFSFGGDDALRTIYERSGCKKDTQVVS